MKAEETVEIDLAGKTSIADTMIITSGRSHRHVGAIADRLQQVLKAAGIGPLRVEGVPACDWVLIDAGDLIVHVFRPEVRGFYNLEKMWGADRPHERIAG
ncbi:ribosome-associated protein IOJAP [Chelatococcus daeguensis]|uniref:Ribosomal silencing factor RsfS n=2 Tax=Chelatococcus TaxID=28209 RepID=A0AAC9NY32_9HYPH|nr:ribosome silencing factor [Chelatococcus daeguensis]KZE33814.1 ribosome-associated protein IOJAP [Chelatococcus daeguensis]